MEEIRLTPGGEDKLAVAALSDIGCVRKNNEDFQGVFPGRDPARGVLMVVADGMGGAAGGEVASRLAVEKVSDLYFGAGSGNTPAQALRKAIEGANSAIYEKASGDPRLGGMGTTCTAVAVAGREIWFGHVGDSRAYLAFEGSLEQLTQDHSLAAETQRQGGPAVVVSRGKNVLTRCLGVRADVMVDVSESAIGLPDSGILVLCSDGLTNQVEDNEILHAISMHLPEGACKRLVELARERGGPDNITVQIARITRG